MGARHEFWAGDPPLRNGPSASLHSERRGWLARAVATGGDAVGIEAPDGAVTWGDFGRRVDARVAMLKGHDVRPGDHIGVVAERSVETVEHRVATLSAGCDDVPLDLSHPADGLAGMLDEARPRHT
jgi:non-ribosomal peptide synthetase component F